LMVCYPLVVFSSLQNSFSFSWLVFGRVAVWYSQVQSSPVQFSPVQSSSVQFIPVQSSPMGLISNMVVYCTMYYVIRPLYHCRCYPLCATYLHTYIAHTYLECTEYIAHMKVSREPVSSWHFARLAECR
jgi:hypothetical protein